MQMPATGFPGVVSRRRHQVMEGELKFVTEQIWPPASGDSFECSFGSQCKVHAKSPFGFPKQMAPLTQGEGEVLRAEVDVCECVCVCVCVEFGFHFHKPFLSQQPSSIGGQPRQSVCTSNDWQLKLGISSHSLLLSL